jgi:hypothetical protein
MNIVCVDKLFKTVYLTTPLLLLDVGDSSLYFWVFEKKASFSSLREVAI